MGRAILRYLENTGVIYECRACSAHLAKHDDLVSRDFKGRTGPAYLFQTATNFTAGCLENRMLMTGLHVIADIYCTRCHAALGWRYDTAFEESQKYKEGKVILELAPIRRRSAIVSGIARHVRPIAEAAWFAGPDASGSGSERGMLVDEEDEEDEEDAGYDEDD